MILAWARQGCLGLVLQPRRLHCCTEALQPRLLTTSVHTRMHAVVFFQARDMMSYAQFLAGMAFNSASLGERGLGS